MPALWLTYTGDGLNVLKCSVIWMFMHFYFPTGIILCLLFIIHSACRESKWCRIKNHTNQISSCLLFPSVAEFKILDCEKKSHLGQVLQQLKSTCAQGSAVLSDVYFEIWLLTPWDGCWRKSIYSVALLSSEKNPNT